jgi:hypothetical protein
LAQKAAIKEPLRMRDVSLEEETSIVNEKKRRGRRKIEDE